MIINAFVTDLPFLLEKRDMFQGPRSNGKYGKDNWETSPLF